MTILNTVELQGFCDTRFNTVRDVLATSLANGEDIGASAAVFINGEPVVDLWGGYIDRERTQAWQRDTIVNNFSTTKTMTALVALIYGPRIAGRRVACWGGSGGGLDARGIAVIRAAYEGLFGENQI